MAMGIRLALLGRRTALHGGLGRGRTGRRLRSRWNPHEENPTPFISESAAREDEHELLRSLPSS